MARTLLIKIKSYRYCGVILCSPPMQKSFKLTKVWTDNMQALYVSSPEFFAIIIMFESPTNNFKWSTLTFFFKYVVICSRHRKITHRNVAWLWWPILWIKGASQDPGTFAYAFLRHPVELWCNFSYHLRIAIENRDIETL